MQLPDEIDVPLVQRLIVSQFPQRAHLPIRRVEHNGWDNRTFRLGEDMSIRLPSAQGYAAQVETMAALSSAIWTTRVGYGGGSRRNSATNGFYNPVRWFEVRTVIPI